MFSLRSPRLGERFLLTLQASQLNTDPSNLFSRKDGKNAKYFCNDNQKIIVLYIVLKNINLSLVCLKLLFAFSAPWREIHINFASFSTQYRSFHNRLIHSFILFSDALFCGVQNFFFLNSFGK